MTAGPFFHTDPDLPVLHAQPSRTSENDAMAWFSAPQGRLPVPALVVVRGASMEPAYAAGDILLVVSGLRPRAGVAVVDLPPDAEGTPRPPAVKRISPAPGNSNRWWVASDNPAGVSSTDIGTLPPTAVLARVICRVRRGHRLRPTRR